MTSETPPSYEAFVAALVKPGHTLLQECTPQKCHLNHMAMGVSGEAGELLDAVKKYTMYDKPIDRANVVEELGDLEFFMEGLRADLGITREETIQRNREKLAKRYASLSFSNEAAQARADKK